MRIRAKLVLGFSVVLLIAVCVAAAGWWGVQTLNDRVTSVAQESLPSVQGLQMMAWGQVAAMTCERALTKQGLTPEQRAAQYQAAARELQRAQEGFQLYQSTPRSPQAQALWEQLVPQWNRWRASHEQVMASCAEFDPHKISNPKDLQGILAGRESDHRGWVLQLAESITAGKAFTGQLDPTQCAFGKWHAQFRSDNTELAATLTAMDDPHRRLHGLGRTIQELLAAGKTDEAQTAYRTDVIGTLKDLGEKFAQARKVVEKAEAPFKKATDLCYGEAIESYNASENTVRQLVAMSVEQAEASRTQAQAAAVLARNTIASVLGVGLVLGIALAAWLAVRITRPIRATIDTVKDLATGEGDLTKRLQQHGRDECAELAQWFNTFLDNLHQMIVDIAQTADDVSAAATEISSGNEQIAAGAQTQASQTTEVATAVEQMSATVQEVSKNAALAAESAKDSLAVAQNGGQIVEQTIGGMRAISESTSQASATVGELGQASEEIGRIIGVINDIADQTNLLALNAAIEAARAGEHGRGFAVVADEVRKLAERTAEATKEVGATISGIQDKTGEAVKAMDGGGDRVTAGMATAGKAGESLQNIVANATGITSLIQQIAAAAEQQSSASEQISRNVESITGITRQNAAAVQQAATASEQLARRAQQLQSLCSRFKLDRHAREEAVAGSR